MTTENALTADRLRAMFSYDRDTGRFTRLVRTASSQKAGDEPGGIDVHGYRVMRIGKKIYKAHRLAFLYVTGQFPPADVDHIDGNRQNNAFSNLRCVDRRTNAENHRKAHSHSKTGLIGASFNRQKAKYVAQIKTKSGLKYLGQFDSAAEAHAAYVSAKRIHHQGNTL